MRDAFTRCSDWVCRGRGAHLFVLGLVLLGILHHLLNLLLAQAALVIGDGDLALLACERVT